MREANTMGLTTANIISSIVAIAANNAKRRAVPTLPIPVPRTHPTSATLPSPTAETSTAASGMDEPHSDPLLSPVSLDKLNGTDSTKESSGPSYRRRLRLGLLSVIPEGSTEKRYVCPACGKDYKNANGVKYHLNRFHSDGYGIPSLLYVGGVGGVGVGGLGGDGVDGEDGEDDDVTQTTDVVPAAVAAASAAVVAPVFSTTVGDEERPIVCFLGSCDKNFKNVAGYKYHVRTVHASLVAEAEHRNILVGFEVPDVQQEGTSRSRLSKGKASIQK
ncbi:hypothetical protein BDR26DRAFT_66833 [Obelidium mucronatum]|nr:hypothetical protein BDR26DRAFT_66833 [Obelidium mucronatum]